MIINYTMSENIKYELGETRVMNGSLKCNNRTTKTIIYFYKYAGKRYFIDARTTLNKNQIFMKDEYEQ